ncbi:MAG: RDD family protein, partial [Ruaniaceae bacterium]|nr:RDD family protein [Ruaniaceae bacterium]
MSQLDQIMTSEAVAIESRPASVMTRALATLLDYLFYAAVFVLVVVAATPLLDNLNSAQGNAIMIVLVATFMVILPTTIETLTHGRSLGKVATGTRVVRDDGGPITFRHAITRWATAPIEVFITFGMLAFTIAMLSPRSKRLGDVLAGTYVARIRGVEEYEYPLIMPPELAPWAENADMRSLPDKVSMYARKYLARTAGLSPETRQRLALLLAA